MSFTAKVKEGPSVLFVMIHHKFGRSMMAGFIQINPWVSENDFENKYFISYNINQYQQTIMTFKGSNFYYKYLTSTYFNFTMPWRLNPYFAKDMPV